MAGRRIRDEAEARASLAAAERSGLVRKEWARREGVDARSLNAWRMNLARRQRAVRLVELLPTVETVEVERSARYLVRRGDVEVEVGDDFKDATLRRLLEVIATC